MGRQFRALGNHVDDLVYVILWALALIAVGFWAARENRRWVVNIAAIFGAIHFYTQWFERLGAEPLTVLLAGILALGFAVGLWYFNRALFNSGRHPPVTRPPRETASPRSTVPRRLATASGPSFDPLML